MNHFKEKSEYEHKLVDLARVARIVAGGKRFRFRATVVLGNRNGKIGSALAKGVDVADAISKATQKAKKSLVEVPIINGTIPHEIEGEIGSAKVFLKPAKPGTGIIAGGAVRPVLELAGIKNILTKIKGSRNKVNNVLATIKALTLLRKPEVFAALRSKKIEDLILVKKTKISKAIKEDKREKIVIKKQDKK